ncbi:hypothetical protein [Azospirillum sp. B506]|nr:hypothetical protein [Azospirillum sp. B506]
MDPGISADGRRRNRRAAYLTLHHAVPHLKTAGGGSVIVTA